MKKKEASVFAVQCNGYSLLPATGARNRTTGVAYGRGTEGNYWSYESEGTGSWRLNFNVGGTNMKTAVHAYALSVRCVQVFAMPFG